MIVVRSRGGVPLRLTDERWRHIESGHRELVGQRDRVLETVSSLELVQSGDRGELLACRFYEHTPVTRKYLVVAYRELGGGDGFVLTAYFTRRPSPRRRTVWTRSKF
jgi:hypothetical protein